MQAGQNIVVGQVIIENECNEGDIIVYDDTSEKFMTLEYAINNTKTITQCTGVAMAHKSLQTENFVPVCVRGAIDAKIPATVYTKNTIEPGEWLKVSSNSLELSLLQIIGKILLPSVRGSMQAKSNAARVYVGPRTKHFVGVTDNLVNTATVKQSTPVETETAVPFSTPIKPLKSDPVKPAVAAEVIDPVKPAVEAAEVQTPSNRIPLHPAATTTNFDAMLVSPNVATILSKKPKKAKKAKR
tara:strand:- start:2706 stop:3431 length:726 start_codon:yes stop_codon:yes gene_type:complete